MNIKRKRKWINLILHEIKYLGLGKFEKSEEDTKKLKLD